MIAALVVAGASVLYCFAPERYGFYPRCPIWTLFHVYCPGCGATRAIAALLHGRLAEALHYNALVTLLLPIAFAYLAVAYVSVVRRGKPRWIAFPVPLTVFMIVAAAVFALARNMPGLMFRI
jgi:Protein of unknown function (DUF2752)